MALRRTAWADSVDSRSSTPTRAKSSSLCRWRLSIARRRRGPGIAVERRAAQTRHTSDRASVEEMTHVDQWTVQTRLRNLQPLYKFSFPDGQQVYISVNTGEFEQ